MSLLIVPEAVTAVLLADAWHKVQGKSFRLDAYEYMDAEADEVFLHGGSEEVAGIPKTGVTWQEPSGEWIACPLTAVLAVKLRARAEESKRVSRRFGRWRANITWLPWQLPGVAAVGG